MIGRIYFGLFEYLSRDAEALHEFRDALEITAGVTATTSYLEDYSKSYGESPPENQLKAILDWGVTEGLFESMPLESGVIGYRITEKGLEQFEKEKSQIEFAEASRLKVDEGNSPVLVDSTDWTGLAKCVSPQNLVAIREQSKALQLTIMQSDADIQTKTDACKRVEAVVILLEAPNVPWREVIALLNHPSVTAFLAAVSLIQFITGLAA